MAAQFVNVVSEMEGFTMRSASNIISLKPSTGRHQALFDALVRIAETPLLKIWEFLGMLGQAVDEKTARVAYLQANIEDWLYQPREEEDWKTLETSIANSPEDLPEPLFDMMRGLYHDQIEILRELVLKMDSRVDITPITCFEKQESELFRRDLIRFLGSLNKEELAQLLVETEKVK